MSDQELGQTGSDWVNLTVALPGEDVETVIELARRDAKQEKVVMAEAIYLKSFIDGELAKPGTRLFIAKPGSLRQIIFE